MSHWCACGNEDNQHSSDCFEPESECVGSHWPPLCCPECSCHSYQEAHPLLRVLQAVEDEDISFVWHGSQLRLQWWVTYDKSRRLTKAERVTVLKALKDGLIQKHYAIGRGISVGMFGTTAAGYKRLHRAEAVA